MMERHLVPLYLPTWLYKSMVRVRRAFKPPAPPPAASITIEGERNIEWSFLSSEMPDGPGEAVEFGCEQGYLSLMAAQKGFRVVANDLQEQSFLWKHPNVEFRCGDFLELGLQRNSFDLAINCSSVEHVGVAGRYGIETEQSDGDIRVMERLCEILKPGGVLLMSAPCGLDTVMAPWCRVYGAKRLPRLFAPFRLAKESYWVKDGGNRWIESDREAALAFAPVHNATDAHRCAYALGGFVLRKD